MAAAMSNFVHVFGYVVFVIQLVISGSVSEKGKYLENNISFKVNQQPPSRENGPKVVMGQSFEDQVRFLDTSREALLGLAKDLRPGKNVTNAFLKVVDDFEQEISNVHATLGGRKILASAVNQVKEITELIKIAAASQERKANTKLLRTLTAEGLFLAQQSFLVNGITKRGAMEENPSLDILGASKFLWAIQNEVGNSVFEEFLSISGLVTLVFVVDTSGSMADDIKAAVAIATKIVRAEREEKVDYILSPFNDPETGPITVSNETQGEDFIAALKRLRAHSGGDCPEVALKGINDALQAGPQPGSSMYVFTDAPPKNATKQNIQAILDKAIDLDIVINFFTNVGCGQSHDVYNTIAGYTGGLVYPLKSSAELRELGRVVSTRLRGSVNLESGGEQATKQVSKKNRRTNGNSGTTRKAGTGWYTGRSIEKRGVGTTASTTLGTVGAEGDTVREYHISLDDSIEDVSVTVTTENQGVGYITLVDPAGRPVTLGRVGLRQGVVYSLVNPVPGAYKLLVSQSAGKHRYKVNGVSGTNIDFGHYYVFVPKRGRHRVPVPLEQPLHGVETVALITLAGSEFVDLTKSLSIEVVGPSQVVYDRKILQPVGQTGVRFMFRFMPPTSEPFQLRLHGQTKKGNTFVRVSKRRDRAVSVILRKAHTPFSNILLRSQTTKLRFQIRRGNSGKLLTKYGVTMAGQAGYGRVLTKVVRVRRGRIGFVQVEFRVPSQAPRGKSIQETVYLTMEDETTPLASLSLSLLIV